MKKFLFIITAVLFVFSSPIIANGQGTTTYTVQPGDSLWKIAVRYQVGLTEIIQANPQFRNPSLVSY